MLRPVVTPRWLALHTLLVVLVAAFCALGNWQLDRARAEAKPKTGADKPPIALAALLEPAGMVARDQVGRRVTATGDYDTTHQFLVAGRKHDGRSGYWLLTPLRAAHGPAVMVVRGWVPDPGNPAVPPTSGEVAVTGRLQPAEPRGKPSTGDGTEITSITTTDLIQRLPYDIYDGYVVLTEQAPPANPAPVAVEAPLRAAPRSTFPLQNAAYAIQWWLFALFAIAFWWRMVRDAVDRGRGAPDNGRSGRRTPSAPPGDTVGARTADPELPQQGATPSEEARRS